MASLMTSLLNSANSLKVFEQALSKIASEAGALIHVEKALK